MVHIEKWHPDRPITAVYYDGEKEMHYVKRFLCEVTTDKRVSFISESEGSELDVVSTAYKPKARIVFNKLLKATKNLPDKVVELDEFIDVKGMKAQGNQLTKLKVKEIVLEHEIEGDEPWPEDVKNEEETTEETPETGNEEGGSTTVEWDMDDEDQPKLF
jgi:topoisomerase-4 subunit A